MIAISVRASRAVCVLFAACVIVPVASIAAEPIDPKASVDRIVVTATRAETALSSVGDSITVIAAQDARRSQKTTVADLLSTTAGVTLSRNGGLGTATAVRIRGAEADQTVVLIDGVKLSDPSATGGGFNFANLLVNDSARIEVLRGSQSTLWGSQAIGGVINIVTPEPTGPLAVTLDSQAGSYETAALTARAQAGNERGGWRVGANYLTTDGVSAFDADLGGREDDGYREVGVNARGVLHLTDALTAELRSVWTRGRSDIDGFPAPLYAFADTREHSTTMEWVSYVGIKIDSLDARLRHRIGTAYTDTTSESIDPESSVPQTFASFGRNLRWEYQGSFTLDEHWSGVFGVERERSELSSKSPSVFDPTPAPLRRDVSLDSAYAQAQFAPVRALTVSGGVRYDDHETFGNATSTQAALAWSVTSSTLLRASYGEGFKAPTLFQLYSQYGNTTLAPEEARDWDAGVEQRWLDDALVLSATYFERTTDSMVDFISCWGVMSPQCLLQPDGYYENVNKARAHGYELALSAQLGTRASIAANYTGLDARNDSRGGLNFGNRLARRPRDTANATFTYAWPLQLSTALAVQYVGHSFDDAGNQNTLGAYTLIDVRASYQLAKAFELYGRIENIFDENYQTTRNYGSIGRGFYLGVRVTL